MSEVSEAQPEENKKVMVKVLLPCIIAGGVWHTGAVLWVDGEEAVHLLRDKLVMPWSPPVERADAPPQRGEG
jgi:hypothetical protein